MLKKCFFAPVKLEEFVVKCLARAIFFFFVGGCGHYHYRIDRYHCKIKHWSPVLTLVKSWTLFSLLGRAQPVIPSNLFVNEHNSLGPPGNVFSAFGESFCCLYEADDPWSGELIHFLCHIKVEGVKVFSLLVRSLQPLTNKMVHCLHETVWTSFRDRCWLELVNRYLDFY